MSLDDTHPTQYFGPDAVGRVRYNDGRVLSLSPASAFLLDQTNEFGPAGDLAADSETLTDEQMLNAKQDGLSLADLLHEANTGHRKGCAFGRTARCTCTYLKQWDRAPAYTAPTYKLGVLSHKPLAASEDIMAELDQLRTEMTMADAVEISRRGTRARCTAHPYSWHFTASMTCAQFEEQLLGAEGFSALADHPVEIVRLAAKTSNRLVRAAQLETSAEKLRTKYWHREYLDVRRQHFIMFSLAIAGWSFSIARGVWGF